MGTYPSEFIRQFNLKDGRQIVLRPIRPEDEQIEQNFVKQLSPRSKYLRFFSMLNELTPPMLSRFTHINYDQEMALIAVLKKNQQEIEIAVGRFAPYQDGKTCEFAIVVDDQWQ